MASVTSHTIDLFPELTEHKRVRHISITSVSILGDDGSSAAAKEANLSPVNAATKEHGESQANKVDASRTDHPYAIICATVMVTAASCMLEGIVTVELPTLARDLHLSSAFTIWPVSVNALTCGSTLLIAGALCDAIGAKTTFLSGAFLQAAFVAAAGFSNTSFQLLLFRGLGGVALSCSLTSTVSIVSTCFGGQRRTMAFAWMGAGQPAGFAIGIVIGGGLTQYATWRLGFFICAGIIGANIVLIVWAVPTREDGTSSWAEKCRSVGHSVDWIGAFIACTALALVSFVFAETAGNPDSIKQPSSISCLVLSFVLMPVFVTWIRRQEKIGAASLIPSSVWSNGHFTIICVVVFFAWGSFNALETMLTLYFQNVQRADPLHTGLYFLPSAVVGFGMELFAGKLVSLIPIRLLVNAGLLIACIAPLLMTFARQSSKYWAFAFCANMFNPIGVDCLFTVANLLTTASFDGKTQALAGGVFNTISQVGKAFGIALAALVAGSVRHRSQFLDKTSPEALMIGYHASFWYCFGISCLTLVAGLVGLRGLRRVCSGTD